MTPEEVVAFVESLGSADATTADMALLIEAQAVPLTAFGDETRLF